MLCNARLAVSFIITTILKILQSAMMPSSREANDIITFVPTALLLRYRSEKTRRLR